MYRVLDFVGPEGFIHGWIKVGAGDGKTHSMDTDAVKQHFGDETAGHLKDAAAAEDRGDIKGAQGHLDKAYGSAAGVIRSGKFGQGNPKHGAQRLLTDINSQKTRLGQIKTSNTYAGTLDFARGGGGGGRPAAPTGKASETTAGRKAAFRRGLALPPASPGGAPGYPITDANHWEKARQSVGRVGDPGRRAALAKLLRKTAPQFGKQQALASSWAAPGGASMANYGYQSILLTESDGYTAGSSQPMGSGMQCLSCGAENDGGAKFCDQCGHDLSGGAEKETSGYQTDSAGGRPNAPETLRTPQLGTAQSAGMRPDQISAVNGSSRNGPQGGYASGSARLAALANSGQQAIGLARAMPVTRPEDILISRAGGRAVVRHRAGGTKIGEIYKGDVGWVGVRPDGTEMDPTTQQRTVLFNLISGYNTGTNPASQRAALQAPPVQTPLMAQYGIPAIRALSTPATSVSGGGRVAMANGGDDDSDDSDDSGSSNGLSPRGQAIYKRLVAKGMKPARAMQFAKNAEKTKPGQFGRSG